MAEISTLAGTVEARRSAREGRVRLRDAANRSIRPSPKSAARFRLGSIWASRLS